ncbi:MAG: FlhC family transcriptional regulator [Ignavibacteriales bacterium]|nr:FlhC family transcriptional regulator [Ignavibacteriales bacterium]
MAATRASSPRARQIERAVTLIQPRRAPAGAGVARPTCQLRAPAAPVQGSRRARARARAMLPFSTDWFMTWQPNIHSSACS